jgi:hypothetical protein
LKSRYFTGYILVFLKKPAEAGVIDDFTPPFKFHRKLTFENFHLLQPLDTLPPTITAAITTTTIFPSSSVVTYSGIRVLQCQAELLHSLVQPLQLITQLAEYYESCLLYSLLQPLQLITQLTE